MYGTTTFNGYPMPMEERFASYKRAGLKSILLWWGNDETPNREGQVGLAEKYDLLIFNNSIELEYINLYEAGTLTAQELDEIRLQGLKSIISK